MMTSHQAQKEGKLIASHKESRVRRMLSLPKKSQRRLGVPLLQSSDWTAYKHLSTEEEGEKVGHTLRIRTDIGKMRISPSPEYT